MVRSAKRIVLGEGTLIPLGFGAAVVTALLSGTVWITRLADATTANTKNIEKIEKDRDSSITEIKNNVSSLQSEILKLRAEFVQRENREKLRKPAENPE